MRLAAVLFVFVLLCPPLHAQTLAATPPMGWNSWNHFAGRVTDKDVRSAADRLVSTGMRDAGYVYVNIDDTWQGTRDKQGVLHPNSRFPDMKALADYIHSRGLKFGLYSSPGPKTCAKYEGSLGHETQDAQLYAAWGVDFLKYDLCSFRDLMKAYQAAHPEDSGAANKLMMAAYLKMGEALQAAGQATGRPILYSLCQYGHDHVWTWGVATHAQMWRTTGDIKDNYDRMMELANKQVGLAKYAGPGHWNDPDMLEVGNGGMTADEYRTHMSLWAILAAPLLAGADLTHLGKEDKTILLNKGVIAIDQDSLGKQGDRVWQHGDASLWRRPLTGGRTAFAVVNGGGRANVAVGLADLGYTDGAIVCDVWAGGDARPQSGDFTLDLPKHGVRLLILSAPVP